MKVLEPGHIYEVDNLDGPPTTQLLKFVNREDLTRHEGTITQEFLRVTIDIVEVLIDRTNHLDGRLRWEKNDQVIKSLTEAQRQMRLALLYYEQHAMERKMEKAGVMPEKVQVVQDGHFKYPAGIKD